MSYLKRQGYQFGYICHLEKGTRNNPSVEVMRNIARALDARVSDVFFWEWKIKKQKNVICPCKNKKDML